MFREAAIVKSSHARASGVHISGQFPLLYIDDNVLSFNTSREGTFGLATCVSMEKMGSCSRHEPSYASVAV